MSFLCVHVVVCQFGDLAYPLAALVVVPSVLLALDVSKYLPSDDEPKDTQDKN